MNDSLDAAIKRENQARSLTVLLALGAAVAYRPYEGVDPNTLSCDPEGHIFLLLPHFEDCRKFYICDHGKEVEQRCPSENTIFDFAQQGCNWSWATTCQLRESDVEGSGESEELEWSDKPEKAQIGVLDILSAATEVRPTVTESRQFHAILDCYNSQSAAKQLPYRGDCQRYWRCSNGVPQAAFCSDGLFFNERSQQCDFEANSKCVDNQPNELGGEFIEYK